MADPLSAVAALGLAANIAQMVDYSLRIISKSSELRKSLNGAVPEHHHAAIVTTSLRDATVTLSVHLGKCAYMDKSFDGDHKRLSMLSKECEGIARGLLKELDGLRLRAEGKNLRWNSFRQALKIVWGKDKVDTLAKTLGQYREELKTEILMLMLRGQDLTHTKLGNIDQISHQILHETRTSQQLSENNFHKILQSVQNPMPAGAVDQDPPILQEATNGTNELYRLLQCGADTEVANKEGYTALILASRAGHSASVLSLLEAGANIEARNVHGATSLGAAAKEGHYGVIQLLLKHGARLRDPDDPNHATALDKALEKDKWKVAKLLLDEGDQVIKSGAILPGKLCICAEQGDGLGVGALLRAGVNIDNARNARRQVPLLIASDHGYAEIVEQLLAAGACTESRDDVGFTALSIAALKGYLNIVRLLLQAGANPNAINKPGWSVVAEASSRGWPEVVDELAARGAYLETRNDGNYTPLCTAAQGSQASTIERLLKHGANTSAQNHDGWTALAEASYHGREDIVKLLLDAGANMELSGSPNPHDPGPEEGWTPLMRAARRGHLKIVQMLVDAGANVDAVTSKGKTALTISEVRKDRVYEVLLEAARQRGR